VEDWDGKLLTNRFHNYIDYVIPQEHIAVGMVATSILKDDGQDFITNTICVNPALTQALLSEKNQEC
jgi:hypothetical protein